MSPLPAHSAPNWDVPLNGFLLTEHTSSGTHTLLNNVEPLPHTTGTGLTTEVALRGSAITVRDEKLNAVEAGYLTQGSAADQHTGLQSFLTAIGTAVGSRGGSGFIPSGIYHMGSGTVTYPQGGVTCCVEGETGAAAFGTATSGIGGTVLKWDTDVVAAPHTVYGITLGGAGGKPQSLSRMTLEGPPHFTSFYGNIPAALGAINARENNVLQDLNIEQFSTGVGWGGTSQSWDHSTPKNLRIAFVGYGFNFLTGSTGSGDFHVYGCSLAGNLAGVGVASHASSGLDGSSWTGVELYGPIGIHRYDDGSGQVGDFMDTCVFVGCSNELNGVAAIFDELWTNGSLGGKIQNCVFTSGFGGTAPNLSQAQWSGTFSVSSSSGTSLTLTDGTGFMFRPGMTVTGAGIPAGTVINSVAGSWPWATVTLTVSNSVSSPTTAVVGMPLLASWVALSVANNEIIGKVNGGSGYPFVATSLPFQRNRVKDWSGVLTRATAGPIAVGSVAGGRVQAYGNTYGDAGDASGTLMGTGYPATTLLAGDVLMQAPTGIVVKCDGTRRPCGVAILANNARTNGAVDYLIRATAGYGLVTIPIQNKTASNIAANALVKVDVANAGGVTTATSPNDGWVIGVNSNAIINAGAAGTLAELWL